MQLAAPIIKQFSSRLRLLHAAMQTRLSLFTKPRSPRGGDRLGQRLIEELRALSDAGLTLREVAAAELGVSEGDYRLWGIRSLGDPTLLSDAWSWGDRGLTIQRWFDVGDAEGRERRRFRRDSRLGRLRAWFSKAQGETHA